MPSESRYNRATLERLMIIDCNTRLWSDARQLGLKLLQPLLEVPRKFGKKTAVTLYAHGRAMSCVDASLIIGHRADLAGAHVPNELIADFVSREPERRFGIAGIDPLSPSADQDFSVALGLGCVGIALSPITLQVSILHTQVPWRIYEKCCEHKLPVVVTMPQPIPSSAILDFARPIHWDEVARTYPELRILFTQMGYPWIDELLVLAGKHKHVFAEVSGVATRPWQVYNALSTAWSLDVIDRLLFGSGFPLSTPQLAIESLYSVNVSLLKARFLPPIPRARIKKLLNVMHWNALVLTNTNGFMANLPISSYKHAQVKRPAHHMMRNVFILVIFVLSGCSTGGGFLSNQKLEVHSMGLHRVVLQPNCTTIVCTEWFCK